MNARAEFLADRRNYIGASDAAVLLGFSPYKTPLDLYLEKRGMWLDEHASEAAHWGTVMEPVLCREYARQRNDAGEELAVVHFDDLSGTVAVFGRGGRREVPRTVPDHIAAFLHGAVHPEFLFIRAHPDGVCVGEGNRIIRGLETKIADLRVSEHWGDADTDQVPTEYLVQVQHQMAVFPQLPSVDVAVLIGGNRFRRYTVYRDDLLIQSMLEQEIEFWQRVQRGDPPDATPDEAGKRSLLRRWPSDTGEEVPIEPEYLAAIRELVLARAAFEEAERRKLASENAVKAILGDRTKLIVGGKKEYVSWKRTRDGEDTDHAAVAEYLFEMLAMDGNERAEVLRRHTTVRPGTRRFLVKLDTYDLPSTESDHDE